MDSINRNQGEQNREDLAARKALEKIKDLVSKAETCFFCTSQETPGSVGARPMAVQQVDDQGNLWFLSADDSHKNLELTKDAGVRLYFQGGKHSDFLLLDGTAVISRDRYRIRELWKPIMKTWFTEGEDDPRITVIKFIPSEGYYWDTKHSIAVAGVKMLIGAATGRTMDDSIEGKIKV
jgi:general stress protein 26